MALRLLTSESVTSGHPDKLCDYISDSILDECLKRDSDARVAIEVFVKGLNNNISPPYSYIIIGGEITLKQGIELDYEGIARQAAYEIGYDSEIVGMNAIDKESCEVLLLIGLQSKEISQGVSRGEGLFPEQGAGDQGVMYGYACEESEMFETLKNSYMPLPILLAHKLTTGIDNARNSGQIKWARPDGKSQVTIAYDEEMKPLHIETIIIAIQHEDIASIKFNGDINKEREFIIKEINEKIISLLPKELINEEIKLIINGTGRFITGGPEGDAGLTGRKIIVDTYGGIGRHGGGAFSGKDPSKVDRSGAYMARWVAKHIVASGIAKKCEIQIAYAIGLSEPVSINIGINTFDSSAIKNEKIEDFVKEIFDFTPSAIIEKLQLKNPIYKKSSYGGHFGREAGSDGSFPWERIDEEIIKQLKKRYRS